MINYVKSVLSLFLLILIFCISCNPKHKNKEPITAISHIIEHKSNRNCACEKLIEFEKKLQESGLIDIDDYESGIKVDLKYSTNDNFLGMNIYSGFNKCYLQKDVCDKLINAQRYLIEINNVYGLLVYDAVRPRSIQQLMWDTIDVPLHEKGKYVANPKYGSLHNFGAAVDVTIIDEDGIELDMGTEFDYFGEKAYPVAEAKLLQSGELNENQINNRKLLRKVMHKAGFFNIQTEWWHFNSCTRSQAYKKYKIIE